MLYDILLNEISNLSINICDIMFYYLNNMRIIKREKY